MAADLPMSDPQRPEREAIEQALTDQLIIDAIAEAEPEYRGAGMWLALPKDLVKARRVLTDALLAAPAPTEKRHGCTNCGERFDDFDELYAHVERHGEAPADAPPATPRQCWFQHEWQGVPAKGDPCECGVMRWLEPAAEPPAPPAQVLTVELDARQLRMRLAEAECREANAIERADKLEAEAQALRERLEQWNRDGYTSVNETPLDDYGKEVVREVLALLSPAQEAPK